MNKYTLATTALLYIVASQTYAFTSTVRVISVTQDSSLVSTSMPSGSDEQVTDDSFLNNDLQSVDSSDEESFAHFELRKGSLKDNIHRAKEFYGVDVLVWSPLIPECVDWKVTSSYTLKTPYMMNALAEMLKQYGLVPKYHSTGNVLQILTTNEYKACTDV